MKKEKTGTLKREGGKYSIIASTRDIDRDGEVILPSAFKNLNSYLNNNPVILGFHRHDDFPIGKATGGKITTDSLVLDIEFADTEKGKEAKYLYDNGFMNSFSVGFIPKDWDTGQKGERIYTDVELLEVSAVPVPANAAANIIRQAKGVKLPELEKIASTAERARDGQTGEGTKRSVRASTLKLYNSTTDSTATKASDGSSVRKNRSSHMTIKELKEKIKNLEALIDVTESESEIVRLADERDEAIRQLGAEEARVDLANKEFRDAQKRDPAPDPRIRVLDTDNYKGVNLKRAVGLFKNHAKTPPSVVRMATENYEAAEKVAKWFTDLVKGAVSVPGKKAMAEGTDSAGGYITPTEESDEVLAYIKESSVSLQDATVVNMTSDKQTHPKEDAAVSVAIRSEGSAVTATSATFDQVELSTVNIDAYTPASKELVQDSPRLIATLMSQFNEAVAKKVDSCVFVGTGSPMSGVFLAAGYSEVFSAGSTHFSELLESNIRNVIAKVPPERLGNAKFYLNHDPLWKYVRGLKDDNGQYLMNQTPNGQGAPNTVWGYPIREKSSLMPSTSAADTGFIVFGDLRGVFIGERLTTMSLMYDPYSDAANGNDRFFLFTRWAFELAMANYLARIVTAS